MLKQNFSLNKSWTWVKPPTVGDTIPAFHGRLLERLPFWSIDVVEVYVCMDLKFWTHVTRKRKRWTLNVISRPVRSFTTPHYCLYQWRNAMILWDNHFSLFCPGDSQSRPSLSIPLTLSDPPLFGPFMTRGVTDLHPSFFLNSWREWHAQKWV